jgi:DNA uptake protein ComE-like DNA-binding protein
MPRLSAAILLSAALSFAAVAVAPVALAANAPTIKLPKKLKKGALNFNTASFDDLSNMKYMNPSRARTILDGRPWKDFNDIYSRKGFFDGGDLKDLKKAFEEGYLFLK